MEQAWALPYPGDDGDNAGCGIGSDQSNYLGRRMEVLKTNLCRYPEAMGVAFRPREVIEMAMEEGYSESTVYRARREPGE